MLAMSMSRLLDQQELCTHFCCCVAASEATLLLNSLLVVESDPSTLPLDSSTELEMHMRPVFLASLGLLKGVHDDAALRIDQTLSFFRNKDFLDEIEMHNRWLRIHREVSIVPNDKFQCYNIVSPHLWRRHVNLGRRRGDRRKRGSSRNVLGDFLVIWDSRNR